MIGVVGPDGPAARVAESLAGTETVVGTAANVVAAGPDVVAAIGDAAVSALVQAGVAAPVLPVDADEGFDSVRLDAAADTVQRALGGELGARTHPVLSVAIDGEAAGRACFDAMLVTSEPARISEYAVETAGGTDQFRADGVVVATPAGSLGYARAVGGPVLDPDAGGLAVVPVAAFTVRALSRVVSASGALTVRVERDEGAISLLVDGEMRREVPTRRPVTVRVDGEFETLVPPTA